MGVSSVLMALRAGMPMTPATLEGTTPAAAAVAATVVSSIWNASTTFAQRLVSYRHDY